MRFGNWRGLTFAFALASLIVAGQPASVRAGNHTIPPEVEAIDLNNGGPYYAPPVPYGHYAKDNSYLGYLCSPLWALKGKLSGLHHGDGLGHGQGHGHGNGGCANGNCGNGVGNGSCVACGGSNPGCGFCNGKKLLHGGFGSGHGGLHGNNGGGYLAGGGCFGSANNAAGFVLPTEQVPVASAQCPESGCFLKARHFHRRGLGCNRCSGNGCNSCQDPSLSAGKLCGGCKGAGCGSCGGLGLHGGHGGGTGCAACGGKGCNLCQGAHGLMGKAHSLLGMPHALLAKALHKGEVKYFVGAGGPVPLTPGYVPYVVTTRSPRDYFAFPPFTDNDIDP